MIFSAPPLSPFSLLTLQSPHFFLTRIGELFLFPTRLVHFIALLPLTIAVDPALLVIESLKC